VLSIALFDQVEALRYADAHATAGLLVAFALATLVLVYRLQANPESRA
jgi:ABC-type molybdate transport system permease subunit